MAGGNQGSIRGGSIEGKVAHGNALHQKSRGSNRAGGHEKSFPQSMLMINKVLGKISEVPCNRQAIEIK
jgi:hypothetical protein